MFHVSKEMRTKRQQNARGALSLQVPRYFDDGGDAVGPMTAGTPSD